MACASLLSCGPRTRDGGMGVGWCREAGGTGQRATRKNAHFFCASPDETETVETMVKFLRMKRERARPFEIHFPCVFTLAPMARKWAIPDGFCSEP